MNSLLHHSVFSVTRFINYHLEKHFTEKSLKYFTFSLRIQPIHFGQLNDPVHAGNLKKLSLLNIHSTTGRKYLPFNLTNLQLNIANYGVHKVKHVFRRADFDLIEQWHI